MPSPWPDTHLASHTEPGPLKRRYVGFNQSFVIISLCVSVSTFMCLRPAEKSSIPITYGYLELNLSNQNPWPTSTARFPSVLSPNTEYSSLIIQHSSRISAPRGAGKAFEHFRRLMASGAAGGVTHWSTPAVGAGAGVR